MQTSDQLTLLTDQIFTGKTAHGFSQFVEEFRNHFARDIVLDSSRFASHNDFRWDFEVLRFRSEFLHGDWCKLFQELWTEQAAQQLQEGVAARVYFAHGVFLIRYRVLFGLTEVHSVFLLCWATKSIDEVFSRTFKTVGTSHFV
ncbi:hypothetical protein D3C87_1021730 [compost metagenome]